MEVENKKYDPYKLIRKRTNAEQILYTVNT